MSESVIKFEWPEGVHSVDIETDLGILRVQKNGMGFLVEGTTAIGIGLSNLLYGMTMERKNKRDAWLFNVEMQERCAKGLDAGWHDHRFAGDVATAPHCAPKL